MGKSSQEEKNSLLGTRLGRFAGRLLKGPQKSNETIPPTVEPEPSVTESVGPAEPVHHEQKSEESNGLRKDRLSCVAEEHIKPEKQKKAITHIEKLLEQIAQLQNEIDTGLQTAISVEQGLFDLSAANEQSSRPTPQPKQVKEQRKQQGDKLPATKGSAHKRKRRSHRNTKKDEGHQANNNTVGKKLRPCGKK
ncbi:MAG: hypothetical protein P8Z79_25950 [Sedimentisphaerales bacterium]|jgi:hypothetical protein